ncbi:hypothetical protein KVR01_009202 [Diaporthe batatas]|uniref:uncharacterized protein n=1 Tax=Diaporthe batatas TaxID=748121 RepID=UPI001D04FA36|nr:uncharacterized protein KVR01_009202 [Diaporthe batatas]KAG8160938.1 hypothetical protein KVR01_009202 [Diaporthe batatas]
MRGFRTETPQLKVLEMTQPFLGRQTKISNGILVGILTGPSIASMRHTSYHLKQLILGGPLDLPLFFETFYDAQHGSLVPKAQHSWPHLEVLIFRGPIIKERRPLSFPLKDEFLKLVGRAAREMPRLNCAVIMIESQPEFGFEGVGMSIRFLTPDVSIKLSKISLRRRNIKRPALTVAMHTPSRSAVRVWREAIEHTKKMSMVVEFKPLPRFDEDGNLVFLPFQDWKD